MAVAAILVLFSAMTGCQQHRYVANWNSANLKVMTYNVCVDMPDFAAVKKIVNEARPDVVFLQEVTKDWVPMLKSLQSNYPHFSSSADEIGYGNVLLSRLPVERVKHLRARYGWHGAWYAVVKAPFGPVQVLGVHLAPPINESGRFTLLDFLKTGPTHRCEIEEFCSEIDFDAPLIVMGDFNESERGTATSWLRRNGLQGALEKFDPFSPTWQWVGSSWVTARLDHIFHSDHLRLSHAQLVHAGVSDHKPVVAAFQAAHRIDPLPASEPSQVWQANAMTAARPDAMSPR